VGGAVFDVGEAEGAQLTGDFVRGEVAENRFTGAGEPISTSPQVRAVLLSVCRLQVVEDNLDGLGLPDDVFEGGAGGARRQIENDAEPDVDRRFLCV
jgi:hypothetical protein